MDKGTIMPRIIWSVLLASWIVFIFAHSMQVAEVSAGMSGGVLDWINARLAAMGIGWQPSEHLIRKAAHFAEYAVLGALSIYTMSRHIRRPARYMLFAAILCLAVPVVDETIQYFVPGRSAQITDVLLDCAGTLVGGAIVVGMFALARRFRKGNE